MPPDATRSPKSRMFYVLILLFRKQWFSASNDGYRGETVKASVAIRAGYAVTCEELQMCCRERLAAYQYPRIIDIREELAKTDSGKMLRRELPLGAVSVRALVPIT
jgi:acyl-coenzyme A synthetase/AMP-(fatty) acid ligase